MHRARIRWSLDARTRISERRCYPERLSTTSGSCERLQHPRSARATSAAKATAHCPARPIPRSVIENLFIEPSGVGMFLGRPPKSQESAGQNKAPTGNTDVTLARRRAGSTRDALLELPPDGAATRNGWYSLAETARYGPGFSRNGRGDVRNLRPSDTAGALVPSLWHGPAQAIDD